MADGTIRGYQSKTISTNCKGMASERQRTETPQLQFNHHYSMVYFSPGALLAMAHGTFINADIAGVYWNSFVFKVDIRVASDPADECGIQRQTGTCGKA